jgi:glycosyltransferase involved in cell wall biosynthesis
VSAAASLVSVVVPVYFNADTLPALVERLEAVARSLPETSFEFVFIDDHSGDESFSILKDLCAKDRRVRTVRLSRNFGSNAAILAGLSHSQGNCIVILSADLQDPPEKIPEMLEAHGRGAEVVLLARRRREDPLLTRLFASIFNRLFRLVVFRTFPKNGFDFMLLSRRVAQHIVAMGEKNSYVFGQTLWLGFDPVVISYDRARRLSGTSRWTLLKKIKYFIDAFTAFSYFPIRAASVVGFLLAIVGFLYAGLVLLLRITHAIPVQGFSALMIVVLITSGTQLIVTGMIGEYIWRVLEESRKRPPFVVATVVDSEGESHPPEVVANRG